MDENGINLEPRWRLSLTTPALGLLPQAEVTEERRAVHRNEVSLRIETAIGKVAVADFVTPPPAVFAKGTSDLTFGAYTRWGVGSKKGRGQDKAVMIHTRATGSDGTRVEVCLFGSIDNCAGYLGGAAADAPRWSSSSTWAIEEFIEHGGAQKAPVYDDDESIAVEILRVINNEGMTGKRAFNVRPSAEWFGEVYMDVELNKERWDLRPGVDLPEPVDRIVIGAPVWVRTSGR